MESNVAPADNEENTLLELLDRLLNTGVVLCGDLVVSVADVELLYLRLQLTLSSVETARKAGWHVPAVRCGKGDRSNLCEAPSGPFRQIGPVPFSACGDWTEKQYA